MNRLRKHLKYPFKYPGIIPRVVNNYCRMLILRRKRLRGIEFALNWECQCNCEHCSISRFKEKENPNGYRALSTEESIDVIRQCMKLGAININLTGGESLLRDDLFEIVRASRPRSAVISVATNGILLTREKVAMLRASGVRAVTISLDGASSEMHDPIRGYPGCFDHAIAGARYAKEAGIEVFFCTILTYKNIENLDIYRMVELSSDLGTMLTINLPCWAGEWSDDQVLLGEAELKVHRELLKEPNVRWEGSSNYWREGCPAGVEKLYISPSGDVMPCPFIHISFGNLAEEPLMAIWHRILTGSPFNRIHDQCLAAENQEFIQSYLGPISAHETYPLDYRCMSIQRTCLGGEKALDDCIEGRS